MRDGFCCTAPGCTLRSTLEAHHVHYRSDGDDENPSNGEESASRRMVPIRRRAALAHSPEQAAILIPRRDSIASSVLQNTRRRK